MLALRSLLADLDAIILSIRFSGNELQINGHFLFGFILLILAAFVHGQSMDGLRKWQTANTQVPKQFEPSTPPIIIAVNGCFGLLVWGLSRPLFWVMLILSLDQLFANGSVILFLLDNLIL